MNSEKLYSYLNNHSSGVDMNLVDLEKLTEQFPYFQTAHLLYSIASKKNDASLFQRSIKKTAIVAVSRNHLYHLLYHQANSENNSEMTKPVVTKNISLNDTMAASHKNQGVIPETNETHITETEAKLHISEQVEREIQKDLVEAFVEKEILKTNEAHKKSEPVTPKDASFGQWLHFLKKNNDQTATVFESESEVNKDKDSKENESMVSDQNELKQKKEHRKELIDKIIEQNLGPIKLNKESKFFAADQKAKESLQENEHLVTETLAKIYALQGNTHKAIRAYQILSLKYPNKSVYFASLIENLRKGN